MENNTERTVFDTLDILVDVYENNDLPKDELVFWYKKGGKDTPIHRTELDAQYRLRHTYRPSMIRRVK
jgi:hypothetical protein